MDTTSPTGSTAEPTAAPAADETPPSTVAPPPPPEPVAGDAVVTAAAAERRGVSVPVFIVTALVVAALTAAFATIWVLRDTIDDQEVQITALEDQTTELRAEVSQNAAALSAATARVAALESRASSPGAETPESAAASAATDGAAAVEQPSVLGDSLPAFAGNGQPDPAIGRPVPDVSGVDYLTGDDVGLADGAPTMIMVWAHWCPYCQQELPNVQALVDQGVFADHGVGLMTIATFEDPTRGNPFEDYVQEFSFPVIRDDRNRANQLGFTGVPSWVIVGSDGNVVGRISGLLGEDVLRGVIERVADESS